MVTDLKVPVLQGTSYLHFIYTWLRSCLPTEATKVR